MVLEADLRLMVDEQQPHCQRCKNAGLPCSGYHSQLKFVDEGSRFAPPGECTSKAVSKPTKTTQCNQPTTNRAATKCAKTLKPPILNLVPQKNTFFLPYTISKLSPVTSRCTSTRTVGILPELLTTQKSALHQSCVQALAAMYFGRTNRDIQACEQGLRLYSKALTQLRADISNLNTELSTIISVMCLCVYENVVFSQPTAWLMHYDGLGRLVCQPTLHRMLCLLTILDAIPRAETLENSRRKRSPTICTILHSRQPSTPKRAI